MQRTTPWLMLAHVGSAVRAQGSHKSLPLMHKSPGWLSDYTNNIKDPTEVLTHKKKYTNSPVETHKSPVGPKT